MASKKTPWRPTRQQLAAARGKRVPDVLAPDLRVLFVGINPGLYSGTVGHHFARPGNRFWKALHAGGFTRRVLAPFEERELLSDGIGVTNIVAYATASASELTTAELRRGAKLLERKVRRSRPQVVAFLGIGAYRSAFGRGNATFGKQQEALAGAQVWVLPNPSGINATYQLPALISRFRILHRSIESATSRLGAKRE